MKLDSVEINTRAMAWNGLWPLGGRVVGCMRLRSRASSMQILTPTSPRVNASCGWGNIPSLLIFQHVRN